MSGSRPVKIHWARKLSYGCGIMAPNMVLLPLMLNFNLFALETVKLDPRVAGLIINVALITDAITDPICGFLVNRTRTKFGQFKPWMVGSIPFIVITFCCCFVYTSSLASSANSMIMSLTGDSTQRQDFIFVQTFCQMSSSILAMLTFGKITDLKRIAVLQTDFVNATNWPNATAYREEKLYYNYATLVSSAVILATGYLCVCGSKETNRTQTEQQSAQHHSSTLLANLRSVLFFPDYAMFLVLGILNAFASSITIMCINFYGLYSVPHPHHLSNLTTVYMVMQLVIIPPMQYLIKVLGVKLTCFIGFVLYMPTGLIFFFLPASAHVAWLYFLVCLNGASFGILTFALYSIIPYLIDDYSKRPAHHARASNETLFYSFFVFFLKVGASLAPLLINFVMKAFGYDQTLDVQQKQPETVGDSLRYILMLSQIILSVVCSVFLSFISINDKHKCLGFAACLQMMTRKTSQTT